MSVGPQLPQRVLDDACAPQLDETRLEQTAGVEPGAPARRSPLADPKFGLAWSNSSISDEVLVRSALRHGAFYLLLEAVLHHDMQCVEQQLALMLADEDVAMSDCAQAEIRRKLANIKRGIAAAGHECRASGCSEGPSSAEA